jgi:hypothetical protein
MKPIFHSFKNSITVMTLSSNYHPDPFAAGAVTFAEELAAAKLALEHAVTQWNLTHAIAEQAQVIAVFKPRRSLPQLVALGPTQLIPLG